MLLEAIGQEDLLNACRMRLVLDLDVSDDAAFFKKFVGEPGDLETHKKLIWLIRHPETPVADMAMEYLSKYYSGDKEAALAIIGLIEQREVGEKRKNMTDPDQENGTSSLVRHAFYYLREYFAQLKYVEIFFMALVTVGECDGIEFGGERRELAALYLMPLLKNKYKEKFFKAEETQKLLELMVCSRDQFVQRGLIVAFRHEYEKEFDSGLCDVMKLIALDDPCDGIRGMVFEALGYYGGKETTAFLIERLGVNGERCIYSRNKATVALLTRRDPAAIAFFEEELFTGKAHLLFDTILSTMEHFENEKFDAFLLGKIKTGALLVEDRKRICRIFLQRRGIVSPEIISAMWDICVHDTDDDVVREAVAFFKLRNKRKLNALLIGSERQEY
jgi:hypothetical protein